MEIGSVFKSEEENDMKILIADDEYVSRKLAMKIFSLYGTCHLAENPVNVSDLVVRCLADQYVKA